MAELPSFFNKTDFYGKLLPGYITVILSLTLFSPNLVVSRDQAISFDIFSAVVFLVAGPAVGFTLQVFHRYLYTIRSIITKDNKNRATEVRRYAALRIACSNDERMELDIIEATYDFSMSTTIALTLIGTYYSVSRGVFELITIPMFILSLILFLGAIFERNESYYPFYEELIRKYNIQ